MARITNVALPTGMRLYYRNGLDDEIAIAFIMMGGGIRPWFASKASISFGADLRNDCFKKVQKFSFANIDAFSTGSLVTRLTNDITLQVQNPDYDGVKDDAAPWNAHREPLSLAFPMNARLARVFLIIMPVMIIAITIIMRTASPKVYHHAEEAG